MSEQVPSQPTRDGSSRDGGERSRDAPPAQPVRDGSRPGLSTSRDQDRREQASPSKERAGDASKSFTALAEKLRTSAGSDDRQSAGSDDPARPFLALADTLRKNARSDDGSLGPYIGNEATKDSRGRDAPSGHRVVELHATFAPGGEPKASETPGSKASDRKPHARPDKPEALEPVRWGREKAAEILNLPRTSQRSEKALGLVREANSSRDVPLAAFEALASALQDMAKDESDRRVASEIGQEVTDIREARLTRWATEAHGMSDDDLRAGLQERDDNTATPDDERKAGFYRLELSRRADEKIEKLAKDMPLADLPKALIYLHGQARETGDATVRRMFTIAESVYQDRVDAVLYEWARGLSVIDRLQITQHLQEVKRGKQSAARILGAIDKASAAHTRELVQRQRVAREKERDYFNRTYPSLRGDILTSFVTWRTDDPELAGLLGGLFQALGGVARGRNMNRAAAADLGRGGDRAGANELSAESRREPRRSATRGGDHPTLAPRDPAAKQAKPAADARRSRDTTSADTGKRGTKKSAKPVSDGDVRSKAAEDYVARLGPRPENLKGDGLAKRVREVKEQARKIDRRNPEALERLRQLYRDQPDEVLAKLKRDPMAKSVFDQRIPPNFDLAKALEIQKRTVPHEASAVYRDRDGTVRWTDKLKSGNMQPAERELRYPKSSHATHTEMRALKHAPLEKGGELRINGQYDPCSACRKAMEKASLSGATVRYWWPGGEFVAKAGKGEFLRDK